MANGAEAQEDFIKYLEARMLHYEQGLQKIQRCLKRVAKKIDEGSLSVERLRELDPVLASLSHGYRTWQALVITWKRVVADALVITWKEQQSVEVIMKHSSEVHLSTLKPRSGTPTSSPLESGHFGSSTSTGMRQAMSKNDGQVRQKWLESSQVSDELFGVSDDEFEVASDTEEAIKDQADSGQASVGSRMKHFLGMAWRGSASMPPFPW
mmetsp:Transcript_103250/g.266929  ORF Transcript_103250/g.266929 Transcript_103250/m.266929 type:complete len:210 (-) Transcript_103250:331-960(-)